MKKFAFFVALVASLASSAFGRGYFAVEGSWLPTAELTGFEKLGGKDKLGGKSAFDIGFKVGATLGANEEHLVYGSISYQTPNSDELSVTYKQSGNTQGVNYVASVPINIKLKWSMIKAFVGYDFRPKINDNVRFDIGASMGVSYAMLEMEASADRVIINGQEIVVQNAYTKGDKTTDNKFVLAAKAGLILNERVGVGAKYETMDECRNIGVYVNYRF